MPAESVSKREASRALRDGLGLLADAEQVSIILLAKEKNRVNAEAEGEQVKRFLYTTEDTRYTLKDGSYTVSLKVRPSWTYSDDLTALINRMNADKKTEQQTGKATAVENVYVDGRSK